MLGGTGWGVFKEYITLGSVPDVKQKIPLEGESVQGNCIDCKS